MNRILLGALAALLLTAAGVFWWQGRAATERGAPPPEAAFASGVPIDELPAADGNNLLSFEEWAVRTANRFKGADKNGDLRLTREEFATTKPKAAVKPECRCPVPRRSGRARPAAEDESDESGDPEL